MTSHKREQSMPNGQPARKTCIAFAVFKYTRKHLFGCCFVFVACFSFAQQNKIDSLLFLIKTANDDTDKISALSKLFLHYQSKDVAKAKKFVNEAFELSKKIDHKKGLSQCYTYFGFMAEDTGNFQQAFVHYQQSLKIAEQIGDKKQLANSYVNIGTVYKELGNYNEAINSYFSALKINEEIGDKMGCARCYGNIGNIYRNERSYPEALKNFLAALDIAKKLDYQSGIAGSYINIGVLYYEQYNYPEALKFFSSALKIFEELEDKLRIAACYDNIGAILNVQKNYTDALKYFLNVLRIREEIRDRNGIAASYINIGNVFLHQNKLSKAKEYLDKALKLSKEIGSKRYLKEGFGDLSKVDSSLGNWKSAYEHHQLFILYRDSLLNEENLKKTVQAQMQYDFDKKEAVADAEHKKELESQQAIAEEKSRKQKIVIWSVGTGLLLIIVFAGLIFRSLRITKKQKNIIESQKNEVSLQKEIVEKQKELVEEHQKEIIDSITYAKRLQQAILPPVDLIKKYLLSSFVLYKPKDIVAGDFYWMEVVQLANESISKLVDEEKNQLINKSANQLIFIAACDCTGHGVPGALVSVVCSNALNRAVKEFNLRDTGKILDKVTDLVLETFEKSGEQIKDGMDVSLLAYNTTSKRIQWSGANNPLWYIECGDIKEIKGDKQPIGKFDNRMPFTTHNIEALPNGEDLGGATTFYLFTDGLPDQFGGPKGKKFMYKRFEENLKSICNLPLHVQEEKLEQAFQDWKGTLDQVDDVTVIAIQI